MRYNIVLLIVVRLSSESVHLHYLSKNRMPHFRTFYKASSEAFLTRIKTLRTLENYRPPIDSDYFKESA